MFWEGRLGFKRKQNLLHGQGQAVQAHEAQPLAGKEPDVSNCQRCTVQLETCSQGGEGTGTHHHPGPAAAAQEGPHYCHPALRLALLTPQPFQVRAHVLWTLALLPPHSGQWQRCRKTWALAGPSRALLLSVLVSAQGQCWTGQGRAYQACLPFPVQTPAPDSPTGRTVLLLFYLNQGSADLQSQRVNKGSPLPLTEAAVNST